MGVTSAKHGRPSPEAIREAVYRKIDEAGGRGIMPFYILSAKWGLLAEQRDAALAELEHAGRVVREVVPPSGRETRPTVVYRTTEAAEFDRKFAREVERRGYARPRSIRVLGRVS